LTFYSKVLSQGLKSQSSIKRIINEKLKQIEDRVKMKLLLLEVDDKKELTNKLHIKESQKIIVINSKESKRNA
jgi:hypothetical protein